MRVLGVCYSNEGGSEGGEGPVSMVCEYTEEGDLFQFLQVGSVIFSIVEIIQYFLFSKIFFVLVRYEKAAKKGSESVCETVSDFIFDRIK